eukprot:2813754-Amphidinium_carterae.1
MYVDDASLMDLSVAKGESQALVGTFMNLLGAPFSKEKRQTMKAVVDFLGVETDLAQAFTQGIVSCWP